MACLRAVFRTNICQVFAAALTDNDDVPVFVARCLLDCDAGKFRSLSSSIVVLRDSWDRFQRRHDPGITLYFQGSTAPTLEAMASNLGHGGQSKSSLQKIRSALLTFEAEAAKKRQHKRKLRGIVEADATSLRKMKLPRTTTLRYFQGFGVASRDSREVQLYDLGQVGLTTHHSSYNHLGPPNT